MDKATLHAAAIGAPSATEHQPLVGEDALADHLQHARHLLAARPDRIDEGLGRW
jgi:hypothetical protein